MATMQYVRYPTTGGGTGGVTIGGAVTGGTPGSVLFVGAGPVLAQDNANFNFNDATNALFVGGTITASNISGTNTGDVTLTAVGSSPNANGASLAGQVLTLQPANGTNPGLLTALAQNIGGAKTFSSTIAASNFSGSSSGTNTGDVTLGTANGLSIVGQVLSLGLSSTSTTGALNSTDWNTFNNGATAAANAANRTLSNLTSPTAINQDLNPNAPNTFSMGTSTNMWAVINNSGIRIFNAGRISTEDAGLRYLTIDSENNSLAIPSGISDIGVSLSVTGNPGLANNNSLVMFSVNSSTNNALQTGDVRIETGNKSAGTGNSGSIVSRTGTSSGGTRGKIVFQDGSEGTTGHVWTSSNTTGSGAWAPASGGSAITSLTGDVTASGPGAAASTIANNVVSNAKLAQMPTLTIKGNNTGGTANALDLTVAQVNAILPVFTSVLNGSVPASGGGTTNFLRADGTWAVAGSGTVSSVALADSTGLFNITGSPVTTSGTLTLASFQSQAQHSFFAAPSGSAGAPTFRAIVASDVPTLNQNTTGTSSNVTGIVAIANGGTGSATQNFVDLSTAQTIAGAKQFSNALTMTEISTPSTPGAGLDKLYVKSDGNLYLVGSNGVERIVGPGISGTNWQNDLIFVPSGFGTTTNNNFWYRRVGDSLQVRGTFSSGTPAASLAAIALPSGYVVDSTKFSSTTDIQRVGIANSLVSAAAGSYTNGYGLTAFYDGSDTANIYLAYQTASQVFVKVNGNSLVGATDPISFEFLVPIVGWSVNNGSNPPTPSMRAYASSTTISGTLATINYTTTDYDNASAYSGGTYTIPQAGVYQVNAALLITGTIALNNTFIMEIQKNGSVVSRSSLYAAGAITNFSNEISDIIKCAANDTLRIQISSSAIVPSIVASNFDNYLSISKLN